MKELKSERQQAEELLLSKFPLLPEKSNKEGMDRIIDAMIEFKSLPVIEGEVITVPIPEQCFSCEYFTNCSLNCFQE